MWISTGTPSRWAVPQSGSSASSSSGPRSSGANSFSPRRPRSVTARSSSAAAPGAYGSWWAKPSSRSGCRSTTSATVSLPPPVTKTARRTFTARSSSAHRSASSCQRSAGGSGSGKPHACRHCRAYGAEPAARTARSCSPPGCMPAACSQARIVSSAPMRKCRWKSTTSSPRSTVTAPPRPRSAGGRPGRRGAGRRGVGSGASVGGAGGGAATQAAIDLAQPGAGELPDAPAGLLAGQRDVPGPALPRVGPGLHQHVRVGDRQLRLRRQVGDRVEAYRAGSKPSTPEVSYAPPCPRAGSGP